MAYNKYNKKGEERKTTRIRSVWRDVKVPQCGWGSEEAGESNKNGQVGNIDDAIEEQQQNSELFTSVDHVNK